MSDGARCRLSRQTVAIALVVAAPAFSGAGPLAAQDLPAPVRFDECCTITAIDAPAGVVKIRDEASVRILRIRVADREVLKKLRIGHRVAVHLPTAIARFPALVATLLSVEGVENAESAGGCGPDAGGDDGVPRGDRR